MVSEQDMGRVNALLDGVEARHGVRVLMAVESGSRAWGFASPDSDFDVRFVYQEPLDRVVRLFPGRDVIEEMTPYHPDGTGVPIDLVGWSLPKALRLAAASNPQLTEWAAGTVTYRADPDFLGELRRLTSQASPRVLAHHYRGLAKKTVIDYLAGPGEPRGKKYLYAVRSLLAANWMLDHPTPGSAPPVRFDRLREETRVSEPVETAISALLDWKVRLGEGEAHRRFPVLDRWIWSDLTRLEAEVPRLPDPVVDREVAERVFQGRVLPDHPAPPAPAL
jgi:predicted nucleotidyltransferase